VGFLRLVFTFYPSLICDKIDFIFGEILSFVVAPLFFKDDQQPHYFTESLGRNIILVNSHILINQLNP
jgi:hypothetical protein